MVSKLKKKQGFSLNFLFLGTNLLQKLKNSQNVNLCIFNHINEF